MSVRPTLNLPPPQHATLPIQLWHSGALLGAAPATSVANRRFNRTPSLCARSVLCPVVGSAPGHGHALSLTWQPMRARLSTGWWVINEGRAVIGCRTAAWGAGRRGRLFPRWEAAPTAGGGGRSATCPRRLRQSGSWRCFSESRGRPGGRPAESNNSNKNP